MTAIAGFIMFGTHVSQIDEYVESKNPFHKETVLRTNFPEWYFSDWRYVNK